MENRSRRSTLTRWRREAMADGAALAAPHMPLHVLYEEAVGLARFHARYWKAKRRADGGLLRPGLEQAVGPGKIKNELNERTGADIRSLLEAVQDAHLAYLLRLDPLPKSPAERGRFVLAEITAALEWLFEDGFDEHENEPRHGRSIAREDEHETVEGLAGALEDYAELAEPHREAIDGVGGFDGSLIDEARAIAAALRAQAFPSPPSPEATAALALRNRLVRLLVVRMNLVRAAARFVFRDDAEILREATSAYVRKDRAAAYRAAARRAATPPRAPAGDAHGVERSAASRAV